MIRHYSRNVLIELAKKMCPLYRETQSRARPEDQSSSVNGFPLCPLIIDSQNLYTVKVRNLSIMDCLKLSQQQWAAQEQQTEITYCKNK